MPAPITNEPYSEQVTRAFNAFKFAPPQQLAAIAPQIQQNPQSPEATGFAMASNFQNQQRSAGAQMPQQTVYQKQIQQLLSGMQPPAPMDAGIAGVGANQYAMQDAAMQDPMRNAGIGAAPENTEGYGAATGGLVALAQGGPVRGFAIGGSGEVEYPEAGTWASPEEEEESEGAGERTLREAEYDEGADEPDEGTPLERGNTYLAQLQNTPKQREARQDGTDVHAPAAGSSAKAIKTKEEATKALQDKAGAIVDAYGQSYLLSPELMDQYQGEIKEANRDKWINALTQGIGGMLQAQTPYIGQAIGQGLLTGAAGYQQGAKEESEARRNLLALRLASEKERHADKRSAVSSVLAQEAATLKAKRDLQRDLLKGQQKGMYALGQANILAGRGGANIVDPVERGKMITERTGQLMKDPRFYQDAQGQARAAAEAERQVDAELARARAALKGVNPTPYNPLQAMQFIGGPFGGLLD